MRFAGVMVGCDIIGVVAIADVVDVVLVDRIASLS